MRTALLVTATYALRPDLSRHPAASHDASAVRARLADVGFEFDVVDVPLVRNFDEWISRALRDRAVGPEDPVILYLSAHSYLDDSGDLRIEVDQPVKLDTADSGHWVSLEKVRASLDCLGLRAVLVLLDLVHNEPDDPVLASEHVAAVRRIFTSENSGFSVLCAARPGTSGSAEATLPSPFTTLFLRSLESHQSRNAAGAVVLSKLIAQLRDDSDLYTDVPCFSLALGKRDLALYSHTGRLSRPSSPPSSHLSRPSSPPSSRLAAPSSSQVPSSNIPGLLATAELHFSRGEWEAATDDFKKVLLLFGEEKSSRRAEVYVRLAQIREAQSRNREAILNFKKALSMDANHPKALQSLADLIHAEGDYEQAAKIRTDLLATTKDNISRFAVYLALADDYEQAKNQPQTLAALEAARAIRPDHPVLLARLAQIYDSLNDFASVVDLKVAIAELKTQPEEVAKGLTLAGQFALEKTKNATRAIEIFEQALAIDPTIPNAFDSIVDILANEAHFEQLAQCMISQAKRLASVGASASQAEVFRSLSVLRRDHLSDLKGAIQALDLCVALVPEDVEARVSLSELLVEAEEIPSAISCLEIAAWHAPGRSETYRSLHQLFSKTSQIDRAFLACSALVHLGEADIDEQLFFDQYKPESAIRPTRSVDDPSWALIYPPSHDQAVRSILQAVASAAIDFKLSLLKQNSLLPKLDPAARQDPETSTVSLTRTFVWASKVLGVPLPEIYVADSVPGGIAAVPADSPTALVGKSVLSGKSLGQLAFLVARDLTFYRPEHYILILYSTLPELTALFLAALQLVRSDLTAPETSRPEVARLKSALSANLSEEQLQNLRSAVDQFDSAGGRVDLVAWARSIEIAATRAGLLICGDLDLVASLLQNDDRQVDDLNAHDRMNDLIPFSVSAPYAKLRERLGVAVA